MLDVTWPTRLDVTRLCGGSALKILDPNCRGYGLVEASTTTPNVDSGDATDRVESSFGCFIVPGGQPLECSAILITRGPTRP